MVKVQEKGHHLTRVECDRKCPQGDAGWSFLFMAHTKKLFCSPIIPESVGHKESEGLIFRTLLSPLHPKISKVWVVFLSFI